MGMTCSDEMSSPNFYRLADAPFLLQDSVRELFKIVAYFRVKDDLLVITRADQSMQERLFDELILKATHYRLKLDEVSLYKVDMLDVQLFMGGPLTDGGWQFTGFLDVAVFEKETCRKVPLGSDSCIHMLFTFPGRRPGYSTSNACVRVRS